MERAVRYAMCLIDISYMTARFIGEHRFSTDMMSLKGQATSIFYRYDVPKGTGDIDFLPI